MFSRGGISSTMQTKLTRRVIISQKDNFIRITLPISAHDHAHDHASDHASDHDSAHDNGSVSKAISTLVACIEGEVDRDTLQSLIFLPYYRIFPTFSTKTHRKWWACTNFVRDSRALIRRPNNTPRFFFGIGECYVLLG